MQNRLLLLPVIGSLCFFSLLFLYGRFGPSIPFSVNSIQTTKTDVFSVTGEGKASTAPNLAIIDLGVQTQQGSVKAAQDQANQIVGKISSDTKSLGVEAKDITTSNYSIYPNYNYSPNGNKVNGYNVNITLSVKVRNLDNVDNVIDRATADGANTISGLQFTLDDTLQKQMENQARATAISEAKAKAQSLASAAGITLGRIINVQENANTPQPIRMLNAAPAEAGGGTSKTSVEPGTSEITIDVTLTYETR